MVPQGLRIVGIANALKGVVGGHGGARGLGADRSRQLFEAVFRAEVDELELGALLIAFRMKGETVDEVAGALEALEAGFIHTVAVESAKPVVAIPSYHGARHVANLTPLLAALLADAGVQVVVHGITEDPGRTTTWQILRAMGIAAARNIEDASNLLARQSPAFVPIEVLSPPLWRLLTLRGRLGVRNIGHTVAHLLNPTATVDCLRLATFNPPRYDGLQSALFRHAGISALIMQGNEGEVVANVKQRARIDWIRAGGCETLIEQDTLPMGDVPSLPPAQDVLATARWIQSVLSGERPVPSAVATQVDCVLRVLRTAPVKGPEDAVAA